jgi:hypothetical protein
MKKRYQTCQALPGRFIFFIETQPV